MSTPKYPLPVIALLLVGCAATGTDLVWKKPNGDSPKIADVKACGAIERPNGTLEVPPMLNSSYDACMKGRGFVQVPGQVTSTWRLGPPSQQRTDDPAFRKAMARNASNVRVHSSCHNLFVPVVQVEKFEQTLSMWHVHFMNNTDRRYVVNFDVTYERGRDTSAQYSEQHKATVRGDAYVSFPLTNLPAQVTRVVGVDVFGCSYTAPSESSDSRPSTAPQTRLETPAPHPTQSRGTAMTIEDAQKLLAAKGYDVGAPDGMLGPRTARAVRAFQADRKIRVSGQLDRATISELLK